MMQLMTRLGGAMEGRMTPIMGMPNPIESMQRNQTLGFRPVGCSEKRMEHYIATSVD